ncbi:MAG: dihydrofolate reductase family protein [Gemmatimonadota bacterium]
MNNPDQSFRRRIVVSAWIAMDGVFDADTMADWFSPYDSADRGAYIQNNVQTSDAVLVGRVTYEMLAGYWPNQKHNESGIADKLNSMPKYVVSSGLTEAGWNNSTIIRDDVTHQVSRLKRQPGQDIIVFGSATLVEGLLVAGLVDELRFLVQPVLAGKGKRFFKEGMGVTGMSLVKTQAFSKGVVLLSYKPETAEQ